MTDALAALPRFSWRGIEVPITGVRSASFQHENAQHKFLYRDGEIVEAVGARNWTFSYTLPMRQDIAKGPYKNLYSVVLPQLVEAMRDRSPGELVDPELGLFMCRPTSLTSDLDVTKRDGTDLRVEFVHSPELEQVDLEVVGFLDAGSLSSEAGLLDGEVALVNWQQEEPPEPSADIFGAIDGIGRQIEFAGNRLSNKLDDAAFRLEKIEKTIDRLEDPKTWGIKRSSRRLREATLRLKERGNDPVRKIITITRDYAGSISEIAADSGMTLDELLRMNPGLASSPQVPIGASVRVFAKAG
jgi:hypothetical protein